MATFACAVLFVALALAIAEILITENDSLSTTLDTLASEEIVEKSVDQTSNKSRPKGSNSRIKPNPGGESEANNPYFKLLLDKEVSRKKLNQDIKSIDDFWNQRNAVADAEIEILLGRNMPFDEREITANKVILAKKYQEYEREVFPPSIHFFKARPLIEESEIFKIIRKLPKGANLFGLLITSAGSDFMYELTFEDNLYFRFEDGLELRFCKERPAAGWRLLSSLRSTDRADYAEDLNDAVKESLIYTGPSLGFPKLTHLLNIYNSLTAYKPNFIKTFKRVLEIFYAENIMYAELFYHFPELYDLDGKTYKPTATLQLCKLLVLDFKKTHKDFIGVRFIYAPFRSVAPSDFRKNMIALWDFNSDLMAGFGLIRDVDADQKPLSFYVEELIKFPKEIKFFFNVALTNKWGFDVDYNLIDALTLSPARLGHGFALNKHPVVLEKLREKKIAVAVSPVTDQVLNRVTDLRNHPHALLVATDYPLVIGNFAGSFWNSTGLSYDWYEVFLGITPRFCDLRCLKQFAVNSWLYSSASVVEKRSSFIAWEAMWHKFIDYVIEGNYN